MASTRAPRAALLSSQLCRQCARALTRRQLLQSSGRVYFSHQPQRFKAPYQVNQDVEIKTDYKLPPLETKVYSFDQVQKLSASPSEERILIDVREPSEFNDGYIPNALNIPIKSQPDALFLPEEEFEDRFGFVKPPTDKEVVFYCKSGVRSSTAAQFALQQGYKHVGEYRGSWLDWQKKGGEASRP